jgi:hypothetical protein
MIEGELKRIADALEKIAAMTPAVTPAPLPERSEQPAPAAAPEAPAPSRRGPGRPRKDDAPPAPTPAPTPAPAPEPDFMGEEQPAAATKEAALDALLAYKARISAKLQKGGQSKDDADKAAHREVGAFLTKVTGKATLTAVTADQYGLLVTEANKA